MTTDGTRQSLNFITDETVYYPHQLSGIRLMARMTNFLLADEMGLGKTLQALTVAAIDFQRGYANRVIVVAPVALKWNWLDECQTFTYFKSMVLDGTPAVRRQQLEKFEAEDYHVLIVNYEQVLAHLDEFNKMGFHIAIFDEAHYMKNYKAKRTKACLALRSNRSFLITGSPMLNQVNELWPLLHRIDPLRYPKYFNFVNRYCVFGGYKDKQIVGVKNRGELTAQLELVMIRRLKKDVLDLPDKQRIVIMVDLHPDQRKMYDQAKDEMRIDRPDEPDDPMEIENPLTKFLRLKQIAGTTFCITPQTDSSGKLDRVIADMDELTRDPDGFRVLMPSGRPAPDAPRVVLFTQFRGVQECLVRRLGEIEVPTFQLHGDVPPPDRLDVVKAWSDYPGAALVCMLQVAGVGLNMTASRQVAFVDKLFVPKLNEQAEDRTHRIGADLTQPIQVREYIARKTVEQRVETILKGKSKLFNTLVEGSDWRKALYEALSEEEED